MVRDFKVFIRDSLQHVDLMREQYPDLPLFILGHSMVSAPPLPPLTAYISAELSMSSRRTAHFAEVIYNLIHLCGSSSYIYLVDALVQCSIQLRGAEGQRAESASIPGAVRVKALLKYPTVTELFCRSRDLNS